MCGRVKSFFSLKFFHQLLVQGLQLQAHYRHSKRSSTKRSPNATRSWSKERYWQWYCKGDPSDSRLLCLTAQTECITLYTHIYTQLLAFVVMQDYGNWRKPIVQSVITRSNSSGILPIESGLQKYRTSIQLQDTWETLHLQPGNRPDTSICFKHDRNCRKWW